MDSSLFAARVEDTAQLCERTDTPRYFGFLSPSQTASADSILKKYHGIRYLFFGGYEGAERVYLACLPMWCEQPDVPIAAITLSHRPTEKLGHRDFLGALVNLGMVREAVGDILSEDGRTVVFLRRDLVPFVSEQLKTVGRAGVRVTVGFDEPLPTVKPMRCGTVTVSSLRLDGVVGALCGVSRKTSADLLADGKVTVNSVGAQKPTRTVSAGDILSVRGYGRFVLTSCDGVSKKGRVILCFSASN